MIKEQEVVTTVTGEAAETIIEHKEDLSKKNISGNPPRKNYLDKPTFLMELVEYRQEVISSGIDPKSPDRPQPSKSIMEKFQLIVDGIANRPNFRNYSYLDEMKSNAFIACWRKSHMFDTNFSTNPFGYYSRIVWQEFLNVIRSEKKQAYLKAKAFYNSPEGMFDSLDTDIAAEFDMQGEGFAVPFFDVDEYETKNGLKKKIKGEKIRKEKSGPLDDFFTDDLEEELDDLDEELSVDDLDLDSDGDEVTVE